MVRGALALARVPVDESPAHSVGQGLRQQHEVDPHAPVIVEVTGAVIPPGVKTVLLVDQPKGVDEPDGLDLGERGPLGLADVGRAEELGRVVDIAILRCDVEVSANGDRRRRITCRRRNQVA